jgi:hypothetical protein
MDFKLASILGISSFKVSGEKINMVVDFEKFAIICQLCGKLLHLLGDYQVFMARRNSSKIALGLGSKGKHERGRRKMKGNWNKKEVHVKQNTKKEWGIQRLKAQS